MTLLTRRAVLAGMAGAGMLTAAGCRGSDVAGVTVRKGTMRSSRWPGREIGWQLAQASEAPATPSPLVVVLHGAGGDSSHAFEVLKLHEHVRTAGVTLATVDGGDQYWHARRTGIDTGAMVLEDFLPFVRRETGFVGRVAFLGWSMGGYGSLLLASQLGPEQVFAVVAASAALWTEPGLSAAGAFDDREDFEDHDVFDRTAVLSTIPVRMDCGRSDPFVPGNTAFGKALPSAELTLDAGGHTAEYWTSHGGPQLAWVREQHDRQ